MLIAMAQSPVSYLIHIPIFSAMLSSKSNTNFGSLVHFWQKWHTSPIEHGSQFRLNSKIGMSKYAIIGRKWLPKCADIGTTTDHISLCLRPLFLLRSLVPRPNPSVTASDKRWGEKAWEQGYLLPAFLFAVQGDQHVDSIQSDYGGIW